MPNLIIRLLGQPSIIIDTYPCKIGVRKAEAVLYYCALSPRPISILRICDLLWPEAEDKKARQNLNDAFYSLRKGFQEAKAPDAIKNCLDRTREGTVQLDKNCDYNCDVEAFEQIANNATPTTDLPTLEKALHLYRGPFLENFYIRDAPEFDAWVKAKRMTLSGAYHKLLYLITPRYLSEGNWPAAIECLEHLRATLLESQEGEETQTINKDNQELVYGLLMTCYALTYRLDLAEEVFGQYEALTQAEITVEQPNFAIKKLHEIIQTYQPSNLRARALIADALYRIGYRTIDSRLEDALMSVYASTGALTTPLEGARYRKALHCAREEAAKHGASLVGTPHLILALCTNRDSSSTWPDIFVPMEALAQAVCSVLGQSTIGGQEPTEYTLSLQRILRMASELAISNRSNEIDIPHLWLALLRENRGLLGQIFIQFNINRIDVIEKIEDIVD